MWLTVAWPASVNRFVVVVSEAVLVLSLSFFMVNLQYRGWKQAGSMGEASKGATAVVQPLKGTETADLLDNILGLSLARFKERSKGSFRRNSYLDSVQVARIPQTGSRQLGDVARKLVGCDASPVGCSPSRCHPSGDPPVECSPKCSLCPKVTGVKSHLVDRAVLTDEDTFSMSQLRSPADRLVWAFLSAGKPHSAPCAWKDGQTRQKALDCFTSMAKAEGYRNIAARTYTGHDAYANVTVCDSNTHRSSLGNVKKRAGSDNGRKGGQGEAGKRECAESLGTTLTGVCRFNHIALSEAMGTSALLLFETLPWIEPRRTFFPGSSPTSPGGGEGAAKILRGGMIRHSVTVKPEKLDIDNLRGIASAFNQVDEALYDFVVAKMCARLDSLGLLQHPAVTAEFGTSLLGDRCASRKWFEGVVEKHTKDTKNCRLFRPLTPPPRSA